MALTERNEPTELACIIRQRTSSGTHPAKTVRRLHVA